MKCKKAQATMWVIIAILVLIVGVAGTYVLTKEKVAPTQQTQVGLPSAVTPTPAGAATPACPQNPAYSYGGVDAFASTTMAGTAQIKLGDNKPVSSLASPTAGKTLKYWLQNTTGAMCDIKDAGVVQCGANSVQTKCYLNSTPTIAVIDTTGAGVSLTDGGATTTSGNNLTLTANQLKNIRIDYTEVKNRPSLPFGGCVAVEYPTNVSTVTLTGTATRDEKGTLGDACPYKWTYSVGNTANTVKKYYVPKGYDIDAKGLTKAINLQMTAGSNPPVTPAWGRITFQPAYYYLTNDGQYALGIEQDKNDVTTKAYGAGTKFTFNYTG